MRELKAIDINSAIMYLNLFVENYENAITWQAVIIQERNIIYMYSICNRKESALVIAII